MIDGGASANARRALEALRVVSIVLFCLVSPATFPSDYRKTVHLFERPEEHGLIVSRNYRFFNDRATILLPIGLCLGLAVPLSRIRISRKATAETLVATLTTAVHFTIVMFAAFPLAPCFGSDSKPMPLTVNPSVFAYLAAYSPIVTNALSAVLSFYSTDESLA